MGRTKINRVLILTGLALTLLLAACVRSATTSDEEITALATEKSAATADAEIQMTLEALLGSATVEVAEATGTPTPVELDVVVEATATATVDGAQLTELAAVLTEAATTPEPEATEELEPSATPTANATSTACFVARYVYDESYPDGTRVDAGQAIQKTWRLQNVGTCDWVGGQYEIVFVTGDRMGGTTPLTINITVLAGNYANFSVNMRAPNEAGTYRGEWILRTKGGDVIGVGPNADLPIWIEIIVRG